MKLGKNTKVVYKRPAGLSQKEVEYGKEPPAYWSALQKMAQETNERNADKVKEALEELNMLNKLPDRKLPLYVNRDWLHPYTQKLYRERLMNARVKQ